MRYNWGYVINKTQAIIEFDKSTFEEISQNRNEKYEYIQTFDDNNIVEYNTIVVNLQSEHSISRIDKVAELYWVVPNEIRHEWTERDLIFRFQKPLQKAAVINIWKVMEQLYFSNVRYFTFYDPKKIEKISEAFLITTNVYSGLSSNLIVYSDKKICHWFCISFVIYEKHIMIWYNNSFSSYTNSLIHIELHRIIRIHELDIEVFFEETIGSFNWF